MLSRVVLPDQNPDYGLVRSSSIVCGEGCGEGRRKGGVGVKRSNTVCGDVERCGLRRRKGDRKEGGERGKGERGVLGVFVYLCLVVKFVYPIFIFYPSTVEALAAVAILFADLR